MARAALPRSAQSPAGRLTRGENRRAQARDQEPDREGGSRRSFWWELAGAELFTLGVAWPLVQPGRVLNAFDTLTYTTPATTVLFDALRSFRLPQWNPYLFGGIGHLANGNSAVFNIFKWPFAGLEPQRAVGLITLLHCMILAAGVVFLVNRRLRLRPPAGLVAAVAMMGSGTVAIRTTQFEEIGVIAWIPWVLVGIDRALDPERPTRSSVALVALAIGATILGGHPQVAFIGAFLIAGWLIARCRVYDRPLRAVVAIAGIGLGVVLAGVQLVPEVLNLGNAAESAGRDVSFVGDPAYVLKARYLITGVLGDVFSSRLTGLTNNGEAMGFVGVAVATLAAVGLVSGIADRTRRSTSLALGAIGTTAVVLALGPRTPLYELGYRFVPFFNQARVPGRWIIVTDFALVLLAAYGVDAVARRRVTFRHILLTAGTALAVAVVVGAAPLRLPPLRSQVVWAVLVVSVLGLVALGSGRPPRWRSAAVVACVGLVALPAIELALMARRDPLRTAMAPAEVMGPPGKAARFLQGRPERVFALTFDRWDQPLYLRDGLRPNVNASLGIRSLDGYDGGPQITKRWISAIQALTAGTPAPSLTLRTQVRTPLDPELYARFGVRWALVDTTVLGAEGIVPSWRGPRVVDGPFEVWENPAYRGEAFLYRATVRTATPAGRFLRQHTSDAVSTTAVVPSDGPVAQCERDCGIVPARLERPTPEHIRAAITTPDHGVLVVAEQFSDGWRARIDGRQAKIVPVDDMLMGVELASGRHVVDLRYETPGLRVGAVASGVAAAVVLALLVGALLERSLRGTVRRRVATAGGDDGHDAGRQ